MLVNGQEKPNIPTQNPEITQIRLYLPAMAYMDVEPNYASNEVAINWNAPDIVIFAILDYVLGEK